MSNNWILDALESGIALEELELHLQPVVAIESGELFGAESFVRWRHPSQGLVPPMRWIPLAEKTGAMAEIALTVLPEWTGLSAGSNRPVISFNLGGRQLLDTHFMEALHRTPPDIAAGLALEVPHLQFDIEAARSTAPEWNWLEVADLERTLAELRLQGFAVWLDDYSDAAPEGGITTHPEVDLIKLDRSALSQPDDWLAHTIAESSTAGKTTLIEGIETPAHWEKARSCGVDLAQGFLISAPLSIEEFANYESEARPSGL